MEKLSHDEIRLLIFLVRTRLKYESRRPRRVIKDGQDIQYQKINELSALRDKLEDLQLTR